MRLNEENAILKFKMYKAKELNLGNCLNWMLNEVCIRNWTLKYSTSDHFTLCICIILLLAKELAAGIPTNLIFFQMIMLGNVGCVFIFNAKRFHSWQSHELFAVVSKSSLYKEILSISIQNFVRYCVVLFCLDINHFLSYFISE